MAAQYKIIHPVKYYRDFLKNDIRPDGRQVDNFRPAILNVDSIGTADGSALAKIGNTTIVCGIKAELAKPLPSEPENGFIIPNIELTPLCSSKFRPGAPSEEAQVYSRILADLLTNSQCVDMRSLCIVREKLVWTLYCDMTCLDHDGSVLDAAVIALTGALKNLKLPLVDYDIDTNTFKVNESVKNGLPLKTTPVATTMIIFDDNIIISDPTAEEEKLSTSTITVATCDGEMCLLHKPGGSSLSPENLEECLNRSLAREKSIQTLFESVHKNTK